LVFLWIGAPGQWAIALVVFPHVYRYAKNLMVSIYRSPHVLAAQAKGLSRSRIVWAHVVLPAAPQLVALAGISVSLAFGASIPIEAMSDVPGVGQLAWRAALDRDLSVLVTITILVALMTVTVNSLADLILGYAPAGKRASE
jgi:peptide/nickel transport system permease protein